MLLLIFVGQAENISFHFLVIFCGISKKLRIFAHRITIKATHE